MKINEMLMNIHNKEFNLERNLQVKKYLPIEVKKTIAQGIIYDSTDNSEGFIKVDSVERYMSYIKYMITMHTNLEYTNEDYDKLCSTEYNGDALLNVIMSYFDADAKECLRILNLMCDDYIYENSIECSVSKLVYNLNGMLSRLSQSINDKVNSIDLSNILKDIDINKITDFLNTIN